MLILPGRLIKVKSKITHQKIDDNLTGLVQEKAIGSTYILLIYVDKSLHLLVGKLGWVNFERGYYIYIGSARKSMESRILRHLAQEKNKFWHIDYLLSYPSPATITNIWISQNLSECAISREIFQHKIGVVVSPGFGSSDCRCPSHLFRVSTENLILLNQILPQNGFYPLLELEERPDK